MSEQTFHYLFLISFIFDFDVLGVLLSDLDDDSLDLCVVLDAVGSVLPAQARLLVTSERYLITEYIVVIHPNCTRTKTLKGHLLKTRIKNLWKKYLSVKVTKTLTQTFVLVHHRDFFSFNCSYCSQ